MDCTHCEPVLLDLCYGELAPPHERDVRAHVAECPTCRKALGKLEAGQALARHLPDEAPSPELSERILRAARAHVRRSSGSWPERVQDWLDSMARIATTRQVAMATLSLLIVFVGLWSIPELTQRRDARSPLVLEPGQEAEPAPPRELPLAPTAQAPPPPTAAEPEASVSAKRARSVPGAAKQPTDGAGKRSERARAYPGSSARDEALARQLRAPERTQEPASASVPHALRRADAPNESVPVPSGTKRPGAEREFALPSAAGAEREQRTAGADEAHEGVNAAPAPATPVRPSAAELCCALP